MSYGHTITLDLPFQDAIARVKDAFGAQGVGTLTEIDVQARRCRLSREAW